MDIKFKPYDYCDMKCYYHVMTKIKPKNTLRHCISCICVYFRGSRITIQDKTLYSLIRNDLTLFHDINSRKIENRSVITNPDNFQFDYDSVNFGTTFNNFMPINNNGLGHDNDNDYFKCCKTIRTQGNSNVSSLNESRSALANAVLNGQLDEVITLLEGYHDINIKDREGYTLLMLAVMSNNLNMVTLLLEHGADINVGMDYDKDYHTLKTFRTRYFINKKECEIYKTPLILAAKEGNCDMMKLLLDNDAKINSISEKYKALAEAAAGNHMEMVKYLISLCTNEHTENHFEYSPLERAIINNHTNMARYLLKTVAEADKVTSEDYFQLQQHKASIILAAQYGCVDIVKMLLDFGTDINGWRQHGNNTPIEIAVKKNHLALVKYLLETGRIDINSVHPDTMSLLALAAATGSCHMIHCLLERGAQIDGGFGNSHTPLAYAAQQGHINATCYLLDNGANIYKGKDSDNVWLCTQAVIEATHHRQRRIVRMLIRRELALSVDKETQTLSPYILYEAVKLDLLGIVSDLYEIQAFPRLFDRGILAYALKHRSYNVAKFILSMDIRSFVRYPTLLSYQQYECLGNINSNSYSVISPYAYQMKAVPIHNKMSVQNLTLLSLKALVKAIGKNNIDLNILPKNLPKIFERAIKEVNY